MLQKIETRVWYQILVHCFGVLGWVSLLRMGIETGYIVIGG